MEKVLIITFDVGDVDDGDVDSGYVEDVDGGDVVDDMWAALVEVISSMS